MYITGTFRVKRKLHFFVNLSQMTKRTFELDRFFFDYKCGSFMLIMLIKWWITHLFANYDPSIVNNSSKY